LTELSPEKRKELAERLELWSWVFLAGLGIFTAIVVSDVLFGWLVDDLRFDLVMLGAGVLGVWSFVELRWLARKFRTDGFSRRPGIGSWIDVIAGSLLALALAVVMGYLIGGRWFALVWPALLIGFVSIGIVRGIRRRRRAAY